MSANDIINELPKLTAAERQRVLSEILELEEIPLSAADEALVEARLAAHRADPASAVPLEEIKRRLRSES